MSSEAVVSGGRVQRIGALWTAATRRLLAVRPLYVLAGVVALQWMLVNELMVAHGKAVCRPIGPRCGDCPIEGYCAKRGVGR